MKLELPRNKLKAALKCVADDDDDIRDMFQCVHIEITGGFAHIISTKPEASPRESGK